MVGLDWRAMSQVHQMSVDGTIADSENSGLFPVMFRHMRMLHSRQLVKAFDIEPDNCRYPSKDTYNYTQLRYFCLRITHLGDSAKEWLHKPQGS